MEVCLNQLQEPQLMDQLCQYLGSHYADTLPLIRYAHRHLQRLEILWDQSEDGRLQQHLQIVLRRRKHSDRLILDVKIYDRWRTKRKRNTRYVSFQGFHVLVSPDRPFFPSSPDYYFPHGFWVRELIRNGVRWMKLHDLTQGTYFTGSHTVVKEPNEVPCGCYSPDYCGCDDVEIQHGYGAQRKCTENEQEGTCQQAKASKLRK